MLWPQRRHFGMCFIILLHLSVERVTSPARSRGWHTQSRVAPHAPSATVGWSRRTLTVCDDEGGVGGGLSSYSDQR
jgi:hypothetical protein